MYKIKISKLNSKFIKVSYSINYGLVNLKIKKNIITYNDRKLPIIQIYLWSFFKPHLPKKWI